MRLWATNTTCFPENFFSSSLTNLQDKGKIFNKHINQAGLPGLNLLEGLELGHRDEDHDGLLAPGALHLRVKAHWDKGKVRVRGKGEGRVHPGGMRTK